MTCIASASIFMRHRGIHVCLAADILRSTWERFCRSFRFYGGSFCTKRNLSCLALGWMGIISTVHDGWMENCWASGAGFNGNWYQICRFNHENCCISLLAEPLLQPRVLLEIADLIASEASLADPVTRTKQSTDFISPSATLSHLPSTRPVRNSARCYMLADEPSLRPLRLQHA